MKSLSEIEMTSKRASRAAGFSWGVAEEVGKCIRSLELFGFSGIKNFNQYLKTRDKKNLENIRLIKKKNKKNKLLICPIHLGVSFLDQVRKIEKFKRCTFQQVAHPLLLLPFLSRSSEVIGKKILFTIDRCKFLLSFNVNISSNFLNKEVILKAKKIEVILLNNKDNFSNLDWKNLYKLSENTFVEETESLKENAAGAGLTDND